MGTGTNRMVLCPRPSRGGSADGGSNEEDMAGCEKEDETGAARDSTMTKTKIATITATESEIETEAGAEDTNDDSAPAQQRKVIQVEYCGTADGSRKLSGHSVLAWGT